MSFWQHPFVQNVLPFLTSLLLHAGIVIFGIATYKVAQAIVSKVKEQVIIPEATMTNGPEGGIPHPGLGGDPNRDAAQDKFPDVPADSQGINDKPSKDLTTALQGGGSGDSSDTIIGQSMIGGGMGKGHGTGSGTGEGVGSGGDGGGALAPFGVPGGGGGIGPKSTFIGVSGNARKVAFICDASGSMIQKFDTLRVELRKAVDGLRPPQSFNIIFFQERDKTMPLDANQMLFASPENKRKAAEFLDRTAPHGETNPIPSLELAFKQGAQLIFLLTDGDFPDNQAVIKRCKELNPGAKVKINTIIFIGNKQEAEEAKAFEAVMKQIATDSGGLSKVADANNLP
jgi:hypothetical protein